MLLRKLNVFFTKYSVNSGSYWLALGLIAVGMATVLSGCAPHH